MDWLKNFWANVMDYVHIAAVLFFIAFALILIFSVGIIFFTLAGFALVFGSGVALGIFIASRLYVACTKTSE